MSSNTSFTICPQCNYSECMREFNGSNGNLYLNCSHCGYCESWIASEHTVAPGAGCISYIVPTGVVHTQYLHTAAEVESSTQWLRERLSTCECWQGYVTRWDADTRTVEAIVGQFEDLNLVIPGIDLDDLGDDQAPEPGDPNLDPFDTATDTIADGSPRCDSHYHAADQHGDLDKARCTRAATVMIRVTASDGVYDAKACRRCADSAVKSAGTMGSPLAVEILGEAE